MSTSPEVLKIAEEAHAEAERILRMPLTNSTPERILNFRALAKSLRDVLDFHYGFEDDLPKLVGLVGNVFETLCENAPGRWNVKRNGMIEFQKAVAALAEYLRGKL